MPYKRQPTPDQAAGARSEARAAWTRALDETRAAANMTGQWLAPAEVERLAREVVVRAVSGLSIEARERTITALVARYIPVAASSSSVATERSRAAGSNRE